MAKTAVGHILLQEVVDTIDGTGVSIIEVFRDELGNPISNKPATSIGGLDVDWLDAIPTNLNANMWGSFGTPTETGSYDGGNLGGTITSSLTGGDSSYNQADSAEGNHYTWSDPHLVSSYRLDGDAGTDGDFGSRGAGRFFKKVIMFEYTDIPAVGSTEFNQDAMEAICEARGGKWNITCSITDGVPRVGDVVTITYFDHTATTVIGTRVGIHDGTGTDDNDWSSLAVEIDGNLLVNGTVVADSIVADYIITNDLQGGAKTSATANDGNAGYYFDGNGDVVIGDGTNDLSFISGTLSVPSKALTTVTTPSDTLIHFEQSDASKYTLRVTGGRGFVSVGETIDLTSRVVNSGTTSTATIPTSELEDDAVYSVYASNPSSIGNTDNDMIKDLNFMVYINPGFAPNTFTSISIGDGNVGNNNQTNSNATVKLFSGFLWGEYNSGASTYDFRLEMVGAASLNTGGALRAHPITSIKRIA